MSHHNKDTPDPWSSLRRPEEHMTMARNPVQPEYMKTAVCRDKTRVLELFIPRKSLTLDATSFGQFNPLWHGDSEMYITFLQMFGYLAFMIEKRSTEAGFSRAVIPFIESVRGKDAMDTVVGYRVRLVIRNETEFDAVPGYIQELCTHAMDRRNRACHIVVKKDREGNLINEEARGGERQAPGTPLLRYQMMTREVYTKLAIQYLGLNIDAPTVRQYLGDDLGSPNNPVNPYHVFGLPRSLHIARKLQASPEFVDPARYVHATIVNQPEAVVPLRDLGPHLVVHSSHGRAHLYHVRYTYPFQGTYAYELPLMYMDPRHMCNYAFPDLDRPVMTNDDERDHYILINAPDDATPADKEALGRRFDATISRKIGPSEDNTIVALAAFNTKRYADAADECVGNRALLKQRNHEIALDTIQRMKSIHCESGAIGRSSKAILQWKKNYLHRNRNFCLTRDKTTRNLSFSSDGWALFLTELDAIYKTHVYHREILDLWLGVLHLYTNLRFHKSVLFEGPAAAGKSFVTQVLRDMMIPGTYESVTYQSPKALAVPDSYEWDMMLWVHEEAMQSFLGAAGNGNMRASSSSSSTANSTADETLLKNWMTSGEVAAMYLDTENGRKTSKGKPARAICMLVLCVNWNTDVLSPPVKSRFRLVHFTERPLEAGLKNLVDNMNTRELQARAECQTRSRRNQCMHFMIQQAIAAKALPEIDLTIAECVIGNVLRLAQNKRLPNTDKKRDIERILMDVRVLVVQSCIDMMDSPLWPYRHETWKDEHLLYFSKYLKASVEHAVQALTLSEPVFEDMAANHLIAHLKNGVLAKDLNGPKFVPANEEKTNSSSRARPPLHPNTRVAGTLNWGKNGTQYSVEVTEAEKNKKKDTPLLMQHHELYVSVVVSEAGHGSKFLRLAQDHTDHITPYYSYEQVVATLERLQARTMNVYRPGTREYIQIKAVSVVGNNVRFARALFDNTSTNVFQQCIRHTLSHPAAGTFSFMMFIPNQYFPAAFNTMVIVANEHGSRLRIRNPNYQHVSMIEMMKDAYRQSRDQRLDRNDQLSIDFGKIYATEEYMDVDDDLDHLGTTLLNLKLGITETEAATEPSNHPYQLFHQLVAYYRDASARNPREHTPISAKLAYPECFPQINPELFKRTEAERRLVTNLSMRDKLGLTATQSLQDLQEDLEGPVINPRLLESAAHIDFGPDHIAGDYEIGRIDDEEDLAGSDRESVASSHHKRPLSRDASPLPPKRRMIHPRAPTLAVPR